MTSNLTQATLERVIAEVQRIAAPDEFQGDQFGFKVAVSKDNHVLFVTSCESEVAAGAVYIFTKKNDVWTFYTKITAADSLVTDHYGCSLATNKDGSLLAVGSTHHSWDKNHGGAVYLYQKEGTSWNLFRKIMPDEATERAYFGSSVAFNSDGTVMVVGAYYDGLEETKTGLAYVYEQTEVGDWTLVATLKPSDGSEGSFFGISCSLSKDGSLIAVGAHGDSKTAANSGAVYLYTKKNGEYTQSIKLTPGDSKRNMQFGRATAVSDDGSTVLVGAHGSSDKTSSGVAFVFAKSGVIWARQAKLVARNPIAEDGFGISVALSDNGSKAIIGAWGNDEHGEASGSAHLFERQGSSWTEKKKVTAGDAGDHKNFGGAVSMDSSGQNVIVGSHCVSSIVPQAGAVYVFN